MLGSLGSFLSGIKAAGPRVYAAALVASASLVLLPESTVENIGLTGLKATYRTELGATFIGSASLLLVHFSFALGRAILRRWRGWRLERAATAMLGDLTGDEKEFLKSFIVNGENTQYVSIYDGIANGLQAKGIVYRASNISIPGAPRMLFAWNLQPFARRALRSKPALLE